MKSIYVKWEALAAPVPSTVLTGAVATATALQGPGKREMHGTCCFDGRMYISGGRNEEQMFSDVWMLAASPASETDGAAIQRVQWTRLTALNLSTPRCAHGAVVVVTAGNEGVAARLVLFAGFTSSGISAECSTIQLPNFGTPTTQSWKSQALSQPIAGRFGLAACSTSIRFVDHISSNPLYAPIFNAPMLEAIAAVRARIAATEDQEGSEKAQQQEHVAMLLFGGVSPEEDFADLHLLLVQ
jgi:subtilisin family serine protease